MRACVRFLKIFHMYQLEGEMSSSVERTCHSLTNAGQGVHSGYQRTQQSTLHSHTVVPLCPVPC